ncbi:hypothetical protein [Janthinobacterium agaricidamnosum]|uniref:Filamentous haemagglutinin haemagglutination activity domain protein n=1 Tax=Janthinobacterium agaricidamnosum NBRC 102515 = DSM 9628 TaxID=1349767 RepID=W0V7M4_9BURK|nr:hypothetical protein [Janthinobacterium agaricidamnosum]CDG83348.1 filamentous haemagglutinin; haemagglutination activity domain protein [Janthinobacterium agaricidamnosum NBRC 102515 = DSM 9628]
MIATAGRDLQVETTVRHAEGGDYPQSRNSIDRVAGLYMAAAGRDVSILGGVIGNAGKDGVTSIVAGRDLTLGVVANTGNQMRGAGNVSLKAGGDADIFCFNHEGGRESFI